MTKSYFLYALAFVFALLIWSGFCVEALLCFYQSMHHHYFNTVVSFLGLCFLGNTTRDMIWTFDGIFK